MSGEITGVGRVPTFSPAVRNKLEKRLVKRAVLACGAFALVLVASEANDHLRPAAIVLVVWLLVGGLASWLLLGLDRRTLTNSVFLVVNTAAIVAFGLVTGWSVPGILLVPCIVAVREVFGEGETRPYTVAQLAIVAVGMLYAGTAWETIVATASVGWTIHWLLHSRGESLRLALADLAQTNASLEGEMTARLAAEAELRQAQKLESVGRLAAGVAHEINTPAQYTKDSLYFLAQGVTALTALLQIYRSATPRTEALAKAEEDADLEYLLDNMPAAFDRSRDGLGRICTIVRSMRDFAHPQHKTMQPADLNRGIESTLVIATSEYKLVADVERDFAELPAVCCHPGEINQVVLNIVVNAAQAIAEQRGRKQRGRITVRTRAEGAGVVIAISDTGGGIPAEIQHRIFEPFFTTKEVGKGTGQGLAMSRAMVTRHGGTLTFESRPPQGTTFYIHLPVAPPVEKAA